MADFLIAWVATLGFAVVFNCPRRELVYTGLCGSLGWLVNLWMQGALNSNAAATFAGALTVGLIGEVLARWRQNPVTVYVIPGMLPLVPGYGLYRFMEQIILKEYTSAADQGFQVVLLALAISSGIIIASSGGKYFNEWRSAVLQRKKAAAKS